MLPKSDKQGKPKSRPRRRAAVWYLTANARFGSRSPTTRGPKRLAYTPSRAGTARRSVTKAIVIHQYGGLEQMRLEYYPDPVAGAGEVLVRVVATSVNPIDYKRRSGMARSAQRRRVM
jgi:hypothetical protein